ncbi:hypothetical protein LEMLEM_LOCUS9002 [Lemmus lemmus]
MCPARKRNGVTISGNTQVRCPFQMPVSLGRREVINQDINTWLKGHNWSLTLLSVAPHDCIPSIRKLRQEDQWFEVSLVCVMRCCK